MPLFSKILKKLVIEACFRDFLSSCLTRFKYFLKISISSISNSHICCCSKKLIQFCKDFIALSKEISIGSSSYEESFSFSSSFSFLIKFIMSSSFKIASVVIISSKSLKKSFNASASKIALGSFTSFNSTIM